MERSKRASAYDEFSNRLGPEDGECYKPEPTSAIVIPVTIKESPPKSKILFSYKTMMTAQLVKVDILFKQSDNMDLPPELKTV